MLTEALIENPNLNPNQTATCRHLHTEDRLIEQPSHHYAKRICQDCGRQLRYLPSPEAKARRLKNAILIEKLLAMEMALEVWETNFIQRCIHTHNYKLKPADQDLLEELVARHLPEELVGDAVEEDVSLRRLSQDKKS
jgi:hypothetical protein